MGFDAVRYALIVEIEIRVHDMSRPERNINARARLLDGIKNGFYFGRESEFAVIAHDRLFPVT